MARRKMSREVTKTTVSVARMVTENGTPKAEELEPVILLGNVTLESAQKQVQKKFDFPVTVYGVQANTDVYEMDVEEFMKHATLKQPEIEAEQVTAE